jgi:hypothetical protein
MRKKEKENYEKVILLITGAIDITLFQVPETKLTQLTERLKQYLFSIEYAIDNYSKVDHIIFCENTNYSYDYSGLQNKAKQRGKILEIITFMGDYDTIQKKGKGYGEGEIIKYAFEKSEILQESQFFYKLTGRILIQNLDKIINSTPSKNAFIFLSNLPCNQGNKVETILYKTDTTLYKQVLINAYKEVNDSRKYFLEYVFFNKLKSLAIPSFGKCPIFIGISGSTGDLYTKSKIQLMKSIIYNKLNFYSNVKTTPFQRMALHILWTLKKII